MNRKGWFELGKQIVGIAAVFYPILVAYLKGRGIELPDLGDYTAKTQILGTALLAQSNKVIAKKSR